MEKRETVAALVLGAIALAFGLAAFGLAVNTHISLTSGTADINARSGRFAQRVSAGGTRENPGVILNGQGVCKDDRESNPTNNVACTSVQQITETVVVVQEAAATPCACNATLPPASTSSALATTTTSVVPTTTAAAMPTTVPPVPQVQIATGTCTLSLLYGLTTVTQPTTYTVRDVHLHDDLFTRMLHIERPSTAVAYDGTTTQTVFLAFANFAPDLRDNAPPGAYALYDGAPRVLISQPTQTVTEALIPNASNTQVSLSRHGVPITANQGFSWTLAPEGFELALTTVVH